MLIELRVKNFRSFKEERALKLAASSVREYPENLRTPDGLDLPLLQSAAIYGANASGKSTLLLAAYYLSRLVSRTQPWAGEDLAPFRLDPGTSFEPTELCANFVSEGVRYEYGISVLGKLILEEWLIAYPGNRPQEWFSRKRSAGEGVNAYRFSKSLKGQKTRLADLTREDVTFLSIAAEFAHAQLSVPARWVAENLSHPFRPVFSPVFGTAGVSDTAERCQQNEAFRNFVSAFLQHADLGISSFEVVTTERPVRVRVPSAAGEAGPQFTVATQLVHEPRFLHRGREGGEAVPFGLGDESEGTRRLFALLSPWYEALQEGRLLLIDELGTSMHPLMTRRLIALFHDPNHNKKGAQLVFTTHDASLLSSFLFRRDQIWFVEKDKEGATDLYSLHDYHPRPDEAIEKGYLIGKYRAIPVFGGDDLP